MKKFAYIGIAAVWLLIIGFIAVQYINSPSEDQYKGLMGFADVLKNYIDERPINPELIDDVGNNTQFAKLTAEIFGGMQAAEKPVNDHYNTILSAKEPVSLVNAEASARNMQLTQQFLAEVNAAHTKREELLQQYAEEMRKIPSDGLIFPTEAMIQGLNKGAPIRVKYRDDLIAIGTYVDYILKFVESRRGGKYFTYDGSKLVFAYPDDQQYYDTVQKQLDDKKRSVDKFRGDQKTDMEATINGIRANKK